MANAKVYYAVAFNLGRGFGANLQSQDLDNWSLLEVGDDIPSEDYRVLERVYGEDLSKAVIEEYRHGFNAALIAQIGGAR